MGFQTFVTRRARKPHTCQCCYKPIEPGTVYYRDVGSYEGDFYCFKFHENCREIVNKVADYLGESIDPGEAISLAEEYGIEI